MSSASPSVYAKIAGITYLLIIIIALLNVIFINSTLVVPGNDAETAKNIIENDLLFRTGIIAVMVMYTIVLILSWSLYVLLKPVNKDLALLALVLRSAEAVLGGATVLLSFVVLGMLNGSGFATAFETEQVEALVGLVLQVQTAGLDVVLILVGLGGTVFCYLFYTSKFVPRILAGWGMFTYVSMFVLSLISILYPDHPEIIEIVLYTLGTFFELLFGFWLLFKGVTLQQENNHAPASFVNKTI